MLSPPPPASPPTSPPLCPPILPSPVTPSSSPPHSPPDEPAGSPLNMTASDASMSDAHEQNVTSGADGFHDNWRSIWANSPSNVLAVVCAVLFVLLCLAVLVPLLRWRRRARSSDIMQPAKRTLNGESCHLDDVSITPSTSQAVEDSQSRHARPTPNLPPGYPPSPTAHRVYTGASACDAAGDAASWAAVEMRAKRHAWMERCVALDRLYSAYETRELGDAGLDGLSSRDWPSPRAERETMEAYATPATQRVLLSDSRGMSLHGDPSTAGSAKALAAAQAELASLRALLADEREQRAREALLTEARSEARRVAEETRTSSEARSPSFHRPRLTPRAALPAPSELNECSLAEHISGSRSSSRSSSPRTPTRAPRLRHGAVLEAVRQAGEDALCTAVELETFAEGVEHAESAAGGLSANGRVQAGRRVIVSSI